MKIQQIRPCSLEEFSKLSEKEQFKHKVNGMIRRQFMQDYGIVTNPKNEYEAFGDLWARWKTVLKNVLGN